jgi:hypothetical protein
VHRRIGGVSSNDRGFPIAVSRRSFDVAKDEGLSLMYRITWRIRRALLSVFGPAQLGDDDPKTRLDQERAEKVAQARAKRAG